MSVRYPAVAGRFYPLEKDALITQIESCFTDSLGPGKISDRGSGRKIVGGLVPHAGYAASGMNAAHFFKRVAEDGLPEAYVIIGPDHYGIPFEAVTCSDPYLTPLGECGVHNGILKRLSEYIPDCPSAHRMEHSVEVEVPFIQYIDPEAKIVPIIMRRQDRSFAEHLGEILKEVCDGMDVIFIASSDLSHYVPKRIAEKLDNMVLDSVSNMDIARMYSDISQYNISACGYGPIAAAMTAASPSSVEVLKHTDSWDSLHYDMEEVVGYGSVVFI